MIYEEWKAEERKAKQRKGDLSLWRERMMVMMEMPIQSQKGKGDTVTDADIRVSVISFSSIYNEKRLGLARLT